MHSFFVTIRIVIKATNISFSYGTEPMFEMASFLVGKGQKVGLVGVNGSGKSTLFKLITGVEETSTGSLTVQGEIGYVPQEVKRDQTLENAPSIKEYVDPESKMPDFEIQALLAGLEYKVNSLETKPNILSGGQKTKLALARALIMRPDILLLDEPTNFMDIAGKHFVMNFLAHYNKTLIIVSHDLELLSEHIDKVLEINKQNKTIDEYKGTYDVYLRLKKEKEELLKRQVLVQQKKIKRMEESLQKKLIRQKSKKGVRQRVVFQKRLEREKEKLPAMPEEVKAFKLNLPDPPRVGELPLRLTTISKSFGSLDVISNLNLTIRRGEKFLLVGPNGSGKSTIIKILMKVIQPDSGFVTEGENLKVGYYSQEFENFDMDATLLHWVQQIGCVDERRARSFLSRFLFDSSKVKQRIGSLSGGEKTRLSIALLMLENNNVLVLDEPTTYLDPLSQRIVLEALKEYSGTLILVSHVEEFVKEINPDRALFMPGARLVLWDNSLLSKISEV